MIGFLETLRGRHKENARLAPHTWFGVGGRCDLFFIPRDKEDLIHFIKNKPMQYTIIGAGSNLLVRDNGIEGAVIRLDNRDISFDGCCVDVGCAMSDKDFALTCADAGVSGLEFLYTIPGSIGGALRMNAGCYGAEVTDRLVHVIAIDPDGKEHIINASEMGHSYRHCSVPKDFIFVSASFRGIFSDPSKIHTTMQEYEERRAATQPTGVKTGGSTFANPGGKDPHGIKTWKLIDEIGYRGMFRGGAMVSEKHCNFLINTGTATATDIESLAEEIREKVLEKHGISLRWEIERLGR